MLLSLGSSVPAISCRAPTFQTPELGGGDGAGEPGETLTDIGEWSNDMAQGMMTLEEEMEAFGERMPAAQYDNKSCDKENEDPRHGSRRS